MSDLRNKKEEMHADICKYLTDLFRRKNEDYGDSFSELRKEFPDAIQIRLRDKYNRIKILSKKEYRVKVEDEKIEDSLLDMANYCIMEVLERRVDEEHLLNVDEFKDHLDKALEDKYVLHIEELQAQLDKTQKELEDCKELMSFDPELMTFDSDTISDKLGKAREELKKEKGTSLPCSCECCSKDILDKDEHVCSASGDYRYLVVPCPICHIPPNGDTLDGINYIYTCSSCGLSAITRYSKEIYDNFEAYLKWNEAYLKWNEVAEKVRLAIIAGRIK